MITEFQKFKELFEQTRGPGYLVFKPIYGSSQSNPGRVRIKVFANPPTGGPFGQKVLKHYGLGPEHKNNPICPRTLGPGHACPVCEWVEKAVNSEDPIKVQQAQKFHATERYMLFVLNLDKYEKEGKKEIGVYDCPPSVHRKIWADMVATDFDFTQWKSPVLLLTGYEIGQGKPKKIEVQVSMKGGLSAEMVELKPEDWLPLFPNSDEIIRIPKPSYLSDLLHGKSSDSDTDWEKDDKPEKDEIPGLEKKAEPEPEKKPEPAAETKVEAKVESKPAEAGKKRPTLDDLLKKK